MGEKGKVRSHENRANALGNHQPTTQSGRETRKKNQKVGKEVKFIQWTVVTSYCVILTTVHSSIELNDGKPRIVQWRDEK